MYSVVPKSSKRVTASRLVQQLNATPVTLFPFELNRYITEWKKGQQGRPASAVESSWDNGAAGERGDARERVFLLPSPHPASFAASSSVVEAGGAGGLGSHDILIIGRSQESQETITQWTYTTAAMHALNGGRVVCVYTPGSGALKLRRFAACVEALVVSQKDCPWEGASHSTEGLYGSSDPLRSTRRARDTDSSNDESEQEKEDASLRFIQRQQQRVLTAMSRVDAVHCHTIEELYAFCTAYQIPSDDLFSDGCGEADDFISGVKCGRRTPPPKAHAPVVPLIIVEGCGGENSYLYRYERAAGQQVPLRHWLLCLLQCRSRGALILIEDISAAQQQRQNQPLFISRMESSSRAAGGKTPPSCMAYSLTKESDLVCRLLAPHQHQSQSFVGHSVARASSGAGTAGHKEKKRPPALLIPHDGTGNDIPLFAQQQQLQRTSAALTSLSAATMDEQLPVADIGGYSITYLTFGTAAVCDYNSRQEAAILATAISSRM